MLGARDAKPFGRRDGRHGGGRGLPAWTPSVRGGGHGAGDREVLQPSQLELAIIAVQLVETVHAVLIVVSLANPAKEEGKRLVGSCVVKEQLERSAVLAVLSATNRLVGMCLQ